MNYEWQLGRLAAREALCCSSLWENNVCSRLRSESVLVFTYKTWSMMMLYGVIMHPPRPLLPSPAVRLPIIH